MKAHKSSVSLTEGPIFPKLIRFAIPVLLGQFFQQMYNVVDSLVLGNFAGADSLAAVTSTGSLIFLLVGFLSGVFLGAGVIISRYFGAKDNKNTDDAIHTTIAFGIISGLILTILGVIFTPSILKIMNTPSDVFEKSSIYVRIYFGGILSVVLYNTATGIYQALGNSRHPLYYLILSTVLNIILDLLFVCVFHWDIAGAAIATILAQSLSCFLALYRLFIKKDPWPVYFSKLHFNPPILRQVIKIGIPSGIQNSVIALANMVVQTNINSFGKIAMAACGSYSKIEGFVFIPITSFALALTTFISQNLGAKQFQRVKKGSLYGIAVTCLLAEIFGLLFYFNAEYFISFFSREKEIIAIATSQAHQITPFYFLLAFSHAVAAILRGTGKTVIPMGIMLSCWCVIRVIYVTIATSIYPQIQVVFWAYPITWSLSTICYICFLLPFLFKRMDDLY